MSATFTAAVTALGNDAALRDKVMSAGSAEERAAILQDAGIEVPTHTDVNSGLANLSDVSGAGVDWTIENTESVFAGAASAL